MVWIRWTAVLVTVLWVSDVRAWPRHAADRGAVDDEAMPSAAEARAKIARHEGVPTPELRRAIVVLGEAGACGSAHHLSLVLNDTERDPLTRAMAALALGELVCDPGLPTTAIAALEDATAVGVPATVRQSGVRALGRARATRSVPLLEVLRNDVDPVVRFAAAQALTKITGTDHFDAEFRDRALESYIDVASRYQILEVRP